MDIIIKETVEQQPAGEKPFSDWPKKKHQVKKIFLSLSHKTSM